MFAENDLLPLSGLQHLVYCERQWALIHIEQQWAENRLTAQGRVLHEVVDEAPDESRRGVRIVRSLALRSMRLGITGKADVVEFPLHGDGAPLPVEYKRGKPKASLCDEVQLCAQALCLEEMLSTTVPSGALYYGTPRRRTEVIFTPELRAETERLAARMQVLYAAALTPRAVYEKKKCGNCSLIELCQPKQLGRPDRASRYLREAVAAHLAASGSGDVERQAEPPVLPE
jgi:CRISPR-associated exonuclease Cas4